MADEMAVPRGRQDKLEGRVAVLEVTVEREAGLRATMDTDLSGMAQTLKAHTRSLQALHDTQQDHTRRLTRMEGDLSTVKEDLTTVKEDVATLKGDVATLKEKVGTVQVGVHAILDLLDTHLARKQRLALPFPRRRPRSQDGPADVG